MGAVAVSLLEAALPGGPPINLVPAVVATVVLVAVAVVGRRLPAPAIFALGPLGVAFVGVAVATTHSYGDGALLYTWPAVWTAYFFGARGTAAIVGWVALVHLAVLLALPPGMASADRWVDVVAGVGVVCAVVRLLCARREVLVAQLAEQARVDALTGLLNRRGLLERLDVEVARARRDGTSLAVVMLDLDHFKQINDHEGHEVGDRVLGWVGERLRAGVRAGDAVGRLGGEELALVLPRADVHEAVVIAERVRSAIAAASSARRAAGVPDRLRVTASAGVVTLGVTSDASALLRSADAALYAAKAAGRDRVELARDGPADSTAGARQGGLLAVVPTDDQSVRRVAAMLGDERVAMLTTLGADGTLTSQPAALRVADVAGDLLLVGPPGFQAGSTLDPGAQVSLTARAQESWLCLAGTVHAEAGRLPVGATEPAEAGDLRVLRVSGERAAVWQPGD